MCLWIYLILFFVFIYGVLLMVNFLVGCKYWLWFGKGILFFFFWSKSFGVFKNILIKDFVMLNFVGDRYFLCLFCLSLWRVWIMFLVEKYFFILVVWNRWWYFFVRVFGILYRKGLLKCFYLKVRRLDERYFL